MDKNQAFIDLTVDDRAVDEIRDALSDLRAHSEDLLAELDESNTLDNVTSRGVDAIRESVKDVMSDLGALDQYADHLDYVGEFVDSSEDEIRDVIGEEDYNDIVGGGE